MTNAIANAQLRCYYLRPEASSSLQNLKPNSFFTVSQSVPDLPRFLFFALDKSRRSSRSSKVSRSCRRTALECEICLSKGGRLAEGLLLLRLAMLIGKCSFAGQRYKQRCDR